MSEIVMHRNGGMGHPMRALAGQEIDKEKA